VSTTTFTFRSMSDGEVRAVGKPEGVPETLAQMLVTEAARQIETPGLWQAVMDHGGDTTHIELQRIGEEDQAVAVLRARKLDGELEIDAAFVDGGAEPVVASTEVLASAAAQEMADLPPGQWQRLVLVLS
jgi:hypothetical protein